MKSILLLNTDNVPFTNRMREYCLAQGVDFRVTFPSEMGVIIQEDSLRLVINDEEVIPKTIQPFIRIAGSFTHFVSFLYYCGQDWGWKLNDTIRLKSDVSLKKSNQLLDCYFNGIAFPKSMVVTAASLFKMKNTIEKEFGYPTVIKGYGARGTQVFKINSFEEFENLELEDHVAYVIQEFIQIDYDIRVLVYNGEVLGGMKRSSETFLHNFSQGGSIEKYELNDEEKNLALAISKAHEVSFAGVDLIYKNGKPLVLEINHSPQIKGFESVTTIDVIKHITDDLISTLE